MDDVVNRLARELAEAIGSAVTEDAQVEACRERARAAGYDMRISLEAVIGFGSRDRDATLSAVASPKETRTDRGLDITANDRRFLRSLRIAADEQRQEVD